MELLEDIMNKLYDKNGSTQIKYIGAIDERINGTQINWVGVIRLGDQMYIPQGAGVYWEYHPYNSKTGRCDWAVTHTISRDEYNELERQCEKMK